MRRGGEIAFHGWTAGLFAARQATSLRDDDDAAVDVDNDKLQGGILRERAEKRRRELLPRGTSRERSRGEIDEPNRSRID